MPGIPLWEGLALVNMRVANTSSTKSASGRNICDDARSLCDLNDVQISDNEIPARINTQQINIERRNGNRTESDNNKSTNQVVEVTTMIKEASDWESNVGQLTGEVNDGKAPNFTRGK